MGGDKRGWEIQSGIDEQLSNSTLLSVRVLRYFITRPRNYYFSKRGSLGSRLPNCLLLFGFTLPYGLRCPALALLAHLFPHEAFQNLFIFASTSH